MQNGIKGFVKFFDIARCHWRLLALVALWPALDAIAEPDARTDKPVNAESAEWHATSTNGFFRVSLRPQSGRVRIGKFQTWEIRLTDAEGQAVFPARFAIGGGMQGHGHGLPTQPMVTGFLPDGRYLVEGMKFNMAGDWTLFLAIEAELGDEKILRGDQAQIDIAVDY